MTVNEWGGNPPHSLSTPRRKNKNVRSHKSISIWTIRHGVHKYAIDQGITVLDCRSNIGLEICRPSGELIYNRKISGKDSAFDEETFLKAYLSQLEENYRKNKFPWLDILRSKKIALSCEHTHDDIMAHRMILRYFLCNIAIENEYIVMHGGEIHVDTRNKLLFYRGQ